jgi:hypothetical protein
MRAPSRIRRIACVAALAAAAAVPAAAAAADVDVPAINGTFAGGAGGWTSTSSCAPLCTVTNTVDSESGASTPGSATVIYTSLAGLLGGLASGTSTWTSPSFTWTDATPESASVSLARKAAISGLLTVGGSANERVQLRDLTTGTTTTLLNDEISTADASFVTDAPTIEPSLLKQAHSYRLLLTTNLAAAALLSGIRVSYDDITLTGTIASSGGTTGGTGGTGGTGSTNGSGGSDPGATAPAGGRANAVLRLLAPRVVRFRPGHAVMVRVRATRAGKAVGRLVVTLRMGKTTRRISTRSDGYASIRVTRRSRAPIRLTFRAGAATAITWARPH